MDSNATAMAMGFPVLATARAAEAGAGMKDCLAVANEACQHVGVYFVVETLEFLHRGGRIGGGARFIGSALNLKPILELRDGRIEACERVRTKSKAIDRVMELVGEQVKGKSKIRLSTLNANAEQEATDLLKRATIEFGAIESILTSVSPVVGVHAGPGTVALAYMTDM
jgi:DegV family protein with EDD domain